VERRDKANSVQTIAMHLNYIARYIAKFMAVFELENLKPSPEGEICPRDYCKNCNNFVLIGGIKKKYLR
jgi:hypothetical protein